LACFAGIEALDLGARTFEHLGKIGPEKKRSGDLGGLVVTA
jgi:hypothetical protein